MQPSAIPTQLTPHPAAKHLYQIAISIDEQDGEQINAAISELYGSAVSSRAATQAIERANAHLPEGKRINARMVQFLANEPNDSIGRTQRAADLIKQPSPNNEHIRFFFETGGTLQTIRSAHRRVCEQGDVRLGSSNALKILAVYEVAEKHFSFWEKVKRVGIKIYLVFRWAVHLGRGGVTLSVDTYLINQVKKSVMRETGMSVDPANMTPEQRARNLNRAMQHDLPEMIEHLIPESEAFHSMVLQPDPAAETTPLNTALQHGAGRMLDRIKQAVQEEEQAQLWSQMDSKGNTPLHAAVSCSNASEELVRDVISQMQAHCPGQLFSANKEGDTPLHLACAHCPAVVPLLLEICSDSQLSTAGSEGKLPLHRLAQHTDTEAASPLLHLLIDRMSEQEIATTDEGGHTAFQAILNGYSLSSDPGIIEKLINKAPSEARHVFTEPLLSSGLPLSDMLDDDLLSEHAYHAALTAFAHVVAQCPDVLLQNEDTSIENLRVHSYISASRQLPATWLNNAIHTLSTEKSRALIISAFPDFPPTTDPKIITSSIITSSFSDVIARQISAIAEVPGLAVRFSLLCRTWCFTGAAIDQTLSPQQLQDLIDHTIEQARLYGTDRVRRLLTAGGRNPFMQMTLKPHLRLDALEKLVEQLQISSDDLESIPDILLRAFEANPDVFHWLCDRFPRLVTSQPYLETMVHSDLAHFDKYEHYSINSLDIVIALIQRDPSVVIGTDQSGAQHNYLPNLIEWAGLTVESQRERIHALLFEPGGKLSQSNAWYLTGEGNMTVLQQLIKNRNLSREFLEQIFNAVCPGIPAHVKETFNPGLLSLPAWMTKSNEQLYTQFLDQVGRNITTIEEDHTLSSIEIAARLGARDLLKRLAMEMDTAQAIDQLRAIGNGTPNIQPLALPVFRIVGQELARKAIAAKDLRTLKTLVALGLDVTYTQMPEYPAKAALESDNAEILSYMLTQIKAAQPESAPRTYTFLLQQAVVRQAVDCIAVLLRQGANPNSDAAGNSLTRLPENLQARLASQLPGILTFEPLQSNELVAMARIEPEEGTTRLSALAQPLLLRRIDVVNTVADHLTREELQAELRFIGSEYPGLDLGPVVSRLAQFKSSHIQAGQSRLEPGPAPAGATIRQLEDLWNGIDWSCPEADTYARGRHHLKQGLDRLLAFVNRRQTQCGTPPRSNPVALRRFYGRIELRLQHIAVFLEQMPPQDRIAYLAQLGEGGHHCGGRHFGEADLVYRQLAGQPLTVEDRIQQALDAFRLGIVMQQVNRYYHGNPDVYQAHLYNSLLHWLGMTDIPDQFERHFSDDKQRLIREFDSLYTPSSVLDYLNDAIYGPGDSLNGELIIDWFKDNLGTQFSDAKTRRWDAVEQRIRRQWSGLIEESSGDLMRIAVKAYTDRAAQDTPADRDYAHAKKLLEGERAPGAGQVMIALRQDGVPQREAMQIGQSVQRLVQQMREEERAESDILLAIRPILEGQAETLDPIIADVRAAINRAKSQKKAVPQQLLTVINGELPEQEREQQVRAILAAAVEAMKALNETDDIGYVPQQHLSPLTALKVARDNHYLKEAVLDGQGRATKLAQLELLQHVGVLSGHRG